MLHYINCNRNTSTNKNIHEVLHKEDEHKSKDKKATITSLSKISNSIKKERKHHIVEKIPLENLEEHI